MSSIQVILAGTANIQIISLRLSPVDNDVISLKRNRMHFIGFGLSQGVRKCLIPQQTEVITKKKGTICKYED